jgi:DNA-binding MarR family transcriptional regulator
MTVKPAKRGRRKTIGLTDAEKRGLKAYRAAKKKAGMPPKLIEVAAEMGVTRQRAEQILKELVVKGRFEKVSRYFGYREVRRNVA